jgi:hypothetical protein
MMGFHSMRVQTFPRPSPSYLGRIRVRPTHRSRVCRQSGAQSGTRPLRRRRPTRRTSFRADVDAAVAVAVARWRRG